MNTPNPDQLSRQGSTDLDKLSDAEVTKLLNDTAKYKGKQPNFQTHQPPPSPGYIDYDARFGGK